MILMHFIVSYWLWIQSSPNNIWVSDKRHFKSFPLYRLLNKKMDSELTQAVLSTILVYNMLIHYYKFNAFYLIEKRF